MRRATLSAPPVFAVAEQAPGRVMLRADTGAVAHVFVLEDDVVRLLLLPDGILRSRPSWAIAPGASDIAEPGRDRMDLAGFACPAFTLDEAGGRLQIATAAIRLDIALLGLHCHWWQRVGDAWTTMAVDRATQAYDFGWWDGRVHHYVARQRGERIYGLGERAGAMDRMGRRFRLVNFDPMGYDAEHSDPLYKSIPYILVADAGGACHGAFYDTTADVAFDFGRELDNYHGPFRHMVAEHGDLDLFMIAGPNPAAVTRRFTWLTGRPAMMPRWSLGYSGSTMSYTDAPDAQSRMAGFLEQLVQHDIGCPSFHLSSGYTSIAGKRYVFHWNRDKFPDPAAFVASYRAAGVHLVPNIKPALLCDHPLYDDVAGRGLFVQNDDGSPTQTQFWDALGSCIDFTNPDAAAWWRGQVASALLDFGVTATWNDNNEYGLWDRRARFHGFGAPMPAAEARPIQALLMARASRAAQAAHAPGRRPYVVTRSGPAGLQRYAQTWSGDNRTDWKTIRFNLKMGLGLALSGVSNSGHDVGGFAGPPPDPELFVRWVQAGILMPRFSIHSWNDDGTANEPWMYGDVLPAIRRLMALRQTLIPFLYDLLHRYAGGYEPILRPVWLDFPGDPGAWADNDDHLLGPDLLVALVTESGATTRRVRPPAGADWIDVWTGCLHPGGDWTELPAALDGPPPLLARAGSGMMVDFAQGGARPAPYRRGVWLFPPPGEGTVHWQAIEDEGEQDGPVDRWRLDGQTTLEVIELTLRRDGPGTIGDAALTIVLPASETRRLTIQGGTAELVEYQGRPAVRVTVDGGAVGMAEERC